MTSSHDSKFLDDPEFQSLLVSCIESLQRGETIARAASQEIRSPRPGDDRGGLAPLFDESESMCWVFGS